MDQLVNVILTIDKVHTAAQKVLEQLYYLIIYLVSMRKLSLCQPLWIKTCQDTICNPQ